MSESDTFSFRIRFDLPNLVRVNIAEDRWEFGPVNGITIILKAEPNGRIDKAGRLSCTGHGFPDEESARSTGELMLDILTVGFSRAQVPADFGDRAHRSHITQYGLEMLEREHGKRVLQDIHGLQTFTTEPKASFARFNARGIVGRAGDRVKEAITAAIELKPSLPPEVRTAYGLYYASAAVENADARFLLLMMAVETLVVQQERQQPAKEHVLSLIRLTEQADLPNDERKSLISSLRWLILESIGSAGRRLASTLNADYDGLTPERFFMKCYDVRGALVHGHHPRMDAGEVGTLAATLETFVGDLISTPILGPRDFQQGNSRPRPITGGLTSG